MSTLQRHRTVLLLSLSLLAGVLSGCGKPGAEPAIQSGQLIGGATKEVAMAEPPPVTGFLPRPNLLQPGGPNRAAFAYIAPNANFASYDKVLLDPVAVWAPPNSQLQNVPKAQRQALANIFYSDLYSSLRKVCRMVTKPSPGTLRIRFAIVDTKTPNATVNTVATYAPYASSAYSVASLAFNKGVGFFAGTATAEAYAVDAMDNSLIWEGVDKRGGTTALVENTFDTWLDVRHAFEAWSIRLASRMQELGACQHGGGQTAAPASKPRRVRH